MASEEEIERLIGELDNDECGVRKAAAETLGEIGEPAVNSLIKALKNEREIVKTYVIQTLGKIANVRAVEPLIKAAEDRRWYVKHDAIKALGRIGNNEAVDGLDNLLGCGDQRLAILVAETLGSIKSDKSLRVLVAALKSRDDNLLNAVACALKNIGLEKLDVEEIIYCMQILQRKRDFKIDENAMNSLLETLNSSDPLLRKQGVLLISDYAKDGNYVDLKKVVEVLKNVENKEEATEIYGEICAAVTKGRKSLEDGKLSQGKPKPQANAKGRMLRLRRRSLNG